MMPRERTNPKQIESAAEVTMLPVVPASYTVSEVAQPSRDGLNELTAPLWRRKGVIAGAAFLGLAIGLGLSLLTPPSFRAYTSLQLEGFTDDQFMRGLI